MKLMPVRKYLESVLTIILLLGAISAIAYADDASVGVNLAAGAPEGKYTTIAGSMDQPQMKRYRFPVSKDGFSEQITAGVSSPIGLGKQEKAAPTLTADTTQNVINKPVELTFTDDLAWREAISGVSINGTNLDKGKYSPKAGKITIDKSVFRISRDYEVVIKASGYADTKVTQKVGLLCITGDGLSKEMVFTRSELEAMQQERVVFSATNDFPMDFPVATEGVPLQVLLNYAGIKSEAQMISFRGTDGYWANFTADELLKQKRYIFPDKTEVKALIALQRIERSADFTEMTDKDTPVLCLGQRAATEQTVLTFVKVLQTITVTAKSPERWEPPAAKIIDPISGKKIEMHGGQVTKGTQVLLTGNAKTKIYYTTDGAEPDLDSKIYNLHGCGPMAGQEEPIVIETDTTIKAKAVWPGELDSETAVFRFTVSDKLANTAGKKIPTGILTREESVSAGSSIFSDIQNSWAREDIEMLARRGLITGKSSNCYAPESKITRAEFTALLVRALDLQEKVLEKGKFEDVTVNDWYAGTVATAAAQNIIVGYDGQLFKPDHNISREEMAAMIVRAARVAGKDDSLSRDEQEQQLAQFQDRQMLSFWAEKEAAIAVKTGIIKGTAGGEFTPQTDVDRAQSAAILHRFLNYAGMLR